MWAPSTRAHAVAPVLRLHRVAGAAPPGQVGQPSLVGQTGVPAVGQRQPAATHLQHMGREAQQVMVGGGPVDPGGGVVLAVGVVVAALAVPEFVAGCEHRRALREQQAGQQRSLQTRAQGQHLGIVGRSFPAAVPAQVVAMAVAVAFAVGFVVAQVVADEVGQREAVVRDDEVDRFPGRALARLEEVGTGAQPLRVVPARAVTAEPEGARGVAELVVPLEPAARELANLVAARPDVPGLGDQAHAGQRGVLRQRGEEGVSAVEAMVAAAQHRGQVEAEAVDVHLLHPIAQAVEHELQHPRVAQVERIAAAAEVVVAGASFRRQAVPASVVEAAPADRRAGLVAFGGVVEDHVEQDFDAGCVQGLDHGPELVARDLALRPRGVARARAEETDGVVAPVVAQAVGLQVPFVDELVHGQQAHGRDAQALQVGDGRF
jgi:hypothetical protein